VTTTRVSPKEAARLMREEGYVYLDVRQPEEFLLGHPAGAYNLPWVPGAEDQFVAAVRQVWPQHQKLLVGCHTGVRSQPAAAAITARGYACVVEQRAGYAGVRDAFGRVTERGWQAEGLPTAMRAEPGRDHASLMARARE
jgi:rhodanese-related sulfurtransferase